MFCLRGWLPLLFIPTNASPAFIFLFFICTYFLNRPCVYCSVLLLVLFITSCNWSDRCFFDFSSNWFQPRPFTTANTTIGGGIGSYEAAIFENMAVLLNSTTKVLSNGVMDGSTIRQTEWTGLGMEWLRSLLGQREWRIECMDIYIRL